MLACRSFSPDILVLLLSLLVEASGSSDVQGFGVSGFNEDLFGDHHVSLVACGWRSWPLRKDTAIDLSSGSGTAYHLL